MFFPKEKISSRSNSLVKQYREVASGKENSLFLLEGIRFLEEAVKAKFPMQSVLYESAFPGKDRGKDLLRSLSQMNVPVFEASADAIAAASGVENSQGIVALAKRPESKLGEFLAQKNTFFLVLAGVADPGNVGSLIRSADAAGAKGVVITEGSASPFNPKCVRATMGSILRLPVFEKVSTELLLNECKTHGVRLVNTDSHSGVEFRDANYSGSIALCLGGEADGIPEALRKFSSLTVRIRLDHEVESLNVAAAGAILLFEIANNRKRS